MPRLVKRRKISKARKIAYVLYYTCPQPGNTIMVTTLAETLAKVYGETPRKWYVRIAQLFAGNRPARGYLTEFERGYARNGYRAIRRREHDGTKGQD